MQGLKWRSVFLLIGLFICVQFPSVKSEDEINSKYTPANKILQYLKKERDGPSSGKQCVMYGVCGDDPDDEDKPLNCAYNGPPVKLEEDNLRTLSFYCPELVETYGNELCCAREQILALVRNLVLPQGLVGRCPSCYYNFRQTFCHLTCSPYQARFMQVNETVMVEEKVMVKKLDMVVMEEFVQKTFDSCKNVIMRTSGGPAMDFMCGPWGANCTPQRWFTYMGSSDNGFAPFDIRIRYMEKEHDDVDFIPFNYDTVPCNETAPGSTRPCSCIDCIESCPTKTTAPAPSYYPPHSS